MRIFFATVAALFSLAQAASAAEEKGDLAFHVGQYSALRANQYKSTEGGVEYRFADRFHGLRPTVGVLVNSDAAMYGYGGINWDLPIGSTPITLTPGFVAGAYHQGDSKDLGHWVEFRSSLEATYRFDDGQRVGAAISHFSNASLNDTNPGVETIQLVYSLPL